MRRIRKFEEVLEVPKTSTVDRVSSASGHNFNRMQSPAPVHDTASGASKVAKLKGET